MSAVRGNKKKTRQTRTDLQIRDEQVFRRIFVLVVLGVIATVVVCLIPVYLSAEATRVAQQSELLKAQIAELINETENLEMQRAALVNSDHLEQLALDELGMVREDSNPSYVELGPESASAGLDGADAVASLAQAGTGAGTGTGATDAGADKAQAQANVPSFGTLALGVLDSAARLTAGEASTLLVGDVGLASIR